MGRYRVGHTGGTKASSGAAICCACASPALARKIAPASSRPCGCERVRPNNDHSAACMPIAGARRREMPISLGRRVECATCTFRSQSGESFSAPHGGACAIELDDFLACRRCSMSLAGNMCRSLQTFLADYVCVCLRPVMVSAATCRLPTRAAAARIWRSACVHGSLGVAIL